MPTGGDAATTSSTPSATAAAGAAGSAWCCESSSSSQRSRCSRPRPLPVTRARRPSGPRSSTADGRQTGRRLWRAGRHTRIDIPMRAASPLCCVGAAPPVLPSRYAAARPDDAMASSPGSGGQPLAEVPLVADPLGAPESLAVRARAPAPPGPPLTHGLDVGHGEALVDLDDDLGAVGPHHVGLVDPGVGLDPLDRRRGLLGLTAAVTLAAVSPVSRVSSERTGLLGSVRPGCRSRPAPGSWSWQSRPSPTLCRPRRRPRRRSREPLPPGPPRLRRRGVFLFMPLISAGGVWVGVCPDLVRPQCERALCRTWHLGLGRLWPGGCGL